MSASAWVGCSRSVSAFMTGTVEFSPILTTIAWSEVLTAMKSQYMLSILAVSDISSPLESWVDFASMNMGIPSSWATATSNETRVLVDGSVKSSATVEFSLSERSDFSDDTFPAIAKSFFMSALVRSSELIRFIGSSEDRAEALRGLVLLRLQDPLLPSPRRRGLPS